MATLTAKEKRAKRMRTLYNNIEAQIMMCDDQEELLLLAALFIACAKNIFLSRYPKEHARAVLHQYIDNVLNVTSSPPTPTNPL